MDYRKSGSQIADRKRAEIKSSARKFADKEVDESKKARRADLRIGRLGKDGTRAANLAIWRAECESKGAVSKAL